VTAVWIIGSCAVIVLAVALIRSWLRRDRDGELGGVSTQWVTEHRLGKGQDSLH
jgi:hypothetical protein